MNNNKIDWDGLVQQKYKLDDKDVEIVMAVFCKYLERKGYYTDIKKAIKYNKFYLIPQQYAIAKDIISCVLKREKATINISVCRQIGKTEIVKEVMVFLFDNFRDLVGESFKSIVVAPDKNTSSIIFNRIGVEITKGLVEDNRRAKETAQGDKVEMMSIYEGSTGGNREGRTTNLVSRDEAHAGSDAVFEDEIEPSTLRTGGSTVYIGNGGFKTCKFHENIKKGNISERDENLDVIVSRNIVHRYTYRQLKDYMWNLGKQGLDSARTWVIGMEDYIRKSGGEKALAVRKNVYCEFLSISGNVISVEQLMRCHDTSIVNEGIAVNEGLYVGVDWAFTGDRTVACFMNTNKEIVDWYVMKEAQEQKEIQRQSEDLYNYCKRKGYMNKIWGIGNDSTGLGVGASEILQEVFDTPISRYTFTAKKKHEWYVPLIDFLRTDIEEERIKLNPEHKHYPIFEKEVTEAEIHTNKQGYISVQSPQKFGYYDDFIAAAAIANDMRSRGEQRFIRSYKYEDDKSSERRVRDFVEEMNDQLSERYEEILERYGR